MATYYDDLMAIVRDQRWRRTSVHGTGTDQPAYVVVRVALGEFRIGARAAIESGEFRTVTGAVYRRVD